MAEGSLTRLPSKQRRANTNAREFSSHSGIYRDSRGCSVATVSGRSQHRFGMPPVRPEPLADVVEKHPVPRQNVPPADIQGVDAGGRIVDVLRKH